MSTESLSYLTKELERWFDIVIGIKRDWIDFENEARNILAALGDAAIRKDAGTVQDEMVSRTSSPKVSSTLNRLALQKALDYGLGHTCPDWTFADVIENSIKAYVAACKTSESGHLEICSRTAPGGVENCPVCSPHFRSEILLPDTVLGMTIPQIAELQNWFERSTGKTFPQFWEEAFNAGAQTSKLASNSDERLCPVCAKSFSATEREICGDAGSTHPRTINEPYNNDLDTPVVVNPRTPKTWSITETSNGYVVGCKTEDSVFPTTIYSTKRAAASRILQLLDIGPIAPQSHPERVEITKIEG